MTGSAADPSRPRPDGNLVLVDTDAGVDDALAILTLLAAPDVAVMGIGSTFGNCTEQQSAANALTTLSIADRTGVPVCVGQPRRTPPPAQPSPHGPDGLGGYARPTPGAAHSGTETAVDQILRTSRDSIGAHLLCLGPLTNIAAALERDSHVLTRFRSVTIMGGMGPAAGRDGVSAVYPQFLTKGDTNTNHDPAAAAAVAAAVGPITWVGMNVTARLRLRFADLAARAETSTRAAFVRDITADYSRYCTTTYDSPERIFTAHDSVAAAVMLDPAVVLSATSAHAVVRRSVGLGDGRASIWGEAAGAGQLHRFVTAVDYRTIESRIWQSLASHGGGDFE